MALLLGGRSTGEGGIPPDTAESVSTRKMWEVSGLLSSERVGSTDDNIGSTTWVAFSKGIMGLILGKGSTAWVSLSNRRVGLTKDGIGSISLVSLSEGRVGLTEDGIGSTTL
jgi:hypothetical protein